MVLYCYEFVTLVLLFIFLLYTCQIWFYMLPSRHLFGKELLTRFAMFRLVGGQFVLYVFP